MSRSNPPRSPIAEKLRRSNPDDAANLPHARSLRRRLVIRFASLMRWLHIYASMLGLATVLFFSVTGITLNHPGMFFGGAERRTESSGTLDRGWVSATGDVAKLEVVEFLRKSQRIRGAMAEFTVDDASCLVTFRGPGYAADAEIDRATGGYHLTRTEHGFEAIINDLHKGRDTGPVWSAFIDASAVLLVFISLTGLVLLFYLKLRRVKGLIVVGAGTVAMIAFWWFGVS